MQSARVLAHFPRQWAMAQWQYTQWARTEERSFVVRHARGDDRRASYPGKMTRFRDFSIFVDSFTSFTSRVPERTCALGFAHQAR